MKTHLEPVFYFLMLCLCLAALIVISLRSSTLVEEQEIMRPERNLEPKSCGLPKNEPKMIRIRPK